MSRTRDVVLTCLATAGLAVTSACSSSGGGGSSSSASTPTASSDVVSAQSTSLGKILVDAKGRTVYEFANDTTDVSTCDGQCAMDWLPVPAPSPLPASPSGVTGELGTTTRSDGSAQLTVAGHPVYTFTGDSAAGQTNGQGLTLNGGLWTVVLPSGAPDTHATGSASNAPLPGY